MRLIHVGCTSILRKRNRPGDWKTKGNGKGKKARVAKRKGEGEAPTVVGKVRGEEEAGRRHSSVCLLLVMHARMVAVVSLVLISRTITKRNDHPCFVPDRNATQFRQRRLYGYA